MKRNSRWMSSFVMLIALGAGLGCARKANDTQITSEVQSKFNLDSGLSSKALSVQTADGVVTLSGNVDNDAQREAAGRQAASVAGVKTVINNLQVGTASTVAASAPPAEQPPAVTDSPAPVHEKTKSVAGKKSRKSRSPDTSSQSKDSSDQSENDQVAGNNQPPAPAAPTNDNPPPVAPPPPPPAPRKFIIDQGTQLTVRLIDPIDSEKNQTGDTFRATLNAPLTSDGEEAVPAGVELTGHLVDVKSAGKFAGQSAIAMQLDTLASGGKTYNLQTDQYKKQAASRGKNTAEKVGGGALVGTIIGALAGGGKGAAIGGVAGAGVGGGVQAASKSQQIKLPSETVLNFTLQAPITVVQAPKPDSNRPKLSDSQ
jgi:hypothetical protein